MYFDFKVTSHYVVKKLHLNILVVKLVVQGIQDLVFLDMPFLKNSAVF